ncbi:MAG: hypothetical protein OXR68_07455 [Alphaproteobacteria bacterium]|nr:hypothetical protein [Alphaproteobacteria bacterium]MDD9920439.1 hypothetical protein [Alphaproteobacteria bacterium]
MNKSIQFVLVSSVLILTGLMVIGATQAREIDIRLRTRFKQAASLTEVSYQDVPKEEQGASAVSVRMLASLGYRGVVIQGEAGAKVQVSCEGSGKEHFYSTGNGETTCGKHSNIVHTIAGQGVAKDLIVYKNKPALQKQRKMVLQFMHF